MPIVAESDPETNPALATTSADLLSPPQGPAAQMPQSTASDARIPSTASETQTQDAITSDAVISLPDIFIPGGCPGKQPGVVPGCGASPQELEGLVRHSPAAPPCGGSGQPASGVLSPTVSDGQSGRVQPEGWPVQMSIAAAKCTLPVAVARAIGTEEDVEWTISCVSDTPGAIPIPAEIEMFEGYGSCCHVLLRP